ncbi:elongation of very long chain fatty acids protein 4 isoform X1 [Lingula anatina]|uniref:Elongation of very long chain fatty acids protein n=1 Tax=Lingula anatina TaxID=7574 RepID=A0A1S3HAB5_LINAN|nr:elongation of very long chain fatty acids protein 4 isoform X1 [Lingula anatina]|eukprot:XP_013382054.1 elongation of very long chain fatty acids protein 4 isoform X1 [Lingula anatina]
MIEVVTDTFNHLYEGYLWTLSIADERVADWLLMQSPLPTLGLVVLYLFSIWSGMKIMKNREPFQLRWAIFSYNLALVILNWHICSELFSASWKLNYSYSCQTVNYSYDPDEMRIAKALWWYYFSKCIEFLDTIFFVLRKKNNQVSFLHVYHHATMFPIWWIGVKWVAGGQSFMGAMINSFIHVVMYTYYGVAALGPEYQKYLWWKKYLTKLQLIQFVVGMAHAAQSLLLQCPFPLWMQVALILYGGSILGLFLNFYFHAYIKSKRDKQYKTLHTNGKGDTNEGHINQNGHSTNGHVKNGYIKNGHMASKKEQ